MSVARRDLHVFVYAERHVPLTADTEDLVRIEVFAEGRPAGVATPFVIGTGGEPFLLGSDLIRAIRAASARGIRTRVVTSAYFGRNPHAAGRLLDEACEAGLDELSISWDDYHEEFVAFEAIKVVFDLARQRELQVAISMVEAETTRWTRERLLKDLGISEDDEAAAHLVYESPLNLTGRAAKELRDAGRRQYRYVGPCPYVVTGPTLSAKNRLLACCGDSGDGRPRCKRVR